MYSRLIKIYVLLIMLKVVNSGLFTSVIIDTTHSMEYELGVIKREINDALEVGDPQGFGLVTFNDTGSVSKHVAFLANEMAKFINELDVSGGLQCPEDTLFGIQQGLEFSGRDATVFVFTDASSKEDCRFAAIENLCKNLRIQVIIFLTGYCPGETSPEGNIKVYYDIARACSGTVIRLSETQLKKAFPFIKALRRNNWGFNDVTTLQPFLGFKEIKIKVDQFTREFLVAVSGDRPSLQIVDPAGTTQEVQTVIDADNAKVVLAENLSSGEYVLRVRSKSATYISVYKKTDIPYHIGFSPTMPYTVHETSLQPIPGRLNYVLIVVSLELNLQVTALEIVSKDGRNVSLPVTNIRAGHYIATIFVESSVYFTCVISARNTLSNQDIRSSMRYVWVQNKVTQPNWSKPEVEMLDLGMSSVDYGAETKVACKVKGYPKPDISWESESGQIQSNVEEYLLEMPATYLSYATVRVVGGSKFFCSAKNAKGEDVKSIEVRINPHFNVVQTPKDETFEYGTEGKLYCEVNAYPEAEVKWYHNDSLVEYSDNVEVVTSEHALVIRNMAQDDVGTYRCEVRNSERSESYAAEVSISGLEAPEVEVNQTEVALQPGQWSQIECRVARGNPRPQKIWRYQNVEGDMDRWEVGTARDDIYVTEETLNILGKPERMGLYTCVGINVVGEDHKDVSVIMNYPPEITNFEEGVKSVDEHNMVELKCDVHAIPKANVWWEIKQDDVVIPLEERHTIDDQNTLRFEASSKDSGEYTCYAENTLGVAQKTVTLNVLVPPHIQRLEEKSKVIELKVGNVLSVSCKGVLGNPTPTLEWKFIAKDYRSVIISRGTWPNALLYVSRVSKANEGTYLCIADNEVANDKIKFELTVN